jgi:transcriptional regulator with XRE-family HTH domain
MEFKVFAGGIIQVTRKEMCEPPVTQEELRKHLGMKSTGAISQVESGAKCLSAENLFKAFDYLAIDPAWFYAEYKEHRFD